jgi:hypothetical protein
LHVRLLKSVRFSSGFQLPEGEIVAVRLSLFDEVFIFEDHTRSPFCHVLTDKNAEVILP